ncbi:hypothetical protein PM082_000403 [Marasmius tenuissimus]|nr:hypothetical protein PM082_000403 [Marasmius tenuissimus]
MSRSRLSKWKWVDETGDVFPATDAPNTCSSSSSTSTPDHDSVSCTSMIIDKGINFGFAFWAYPMCESTPLWGYEELHGRPPRWSSERGLQGADRRLSAEQVLQVFIALTSLSHTKLSHAITSCPPLQLLNIEPSGSPAAGSRVSISFELYGRWDSKAWDQLFNTGGKGFWSNTLLEVFSSGPCRGSRRLVN